MTDEKKEEEKKEEQISEKSEKQVEEKKEEKKEQTEKKDEERAKAWKKWSKAEENELKELCRKARSWAELKSLVAESKLLKEKKYRDNIRRKARHLGLTNHFIDRRRTISKEEEIRQKQFLFSESERIVPRETLEITSEVWNKPDTKIGLISRIDYGSEGFRAGLIRLAFEQAAQRGFRFSVLVGGLVHKKSLEEELKRQLGELKERQRGLKLSVEEKREEKEQLVEDFYMECAQSLAELIPCIKKPGGELIKLYLFTSMPFDGKIGHEIAQRLTALRKDDDILYWGFNPEVPLLVKHINKLLFPLVPQKQSFMRSDYYSTPVQRELKDILKRSMSLPHMYAVGCFASSVLKPEGEARVLFVSLPALHKLSETRTSENQVGIRVVNYNKNSEFSVETHSYKDLIRDERRLITIPSSCSKLLTDIVKQLQLKKAPMSSGVLEYHLKEEFNWKKITREEVIKAIRDAKRLRPTIEFDHLSNRYDFDPRWFQEKVVYKLPPQEELLEDCFVSFACPHIGAPQTNYEFIITDIPKYILRSNAKYLVGAGDFTQGTYHHLVARKQVYRGLTDEEQELLAAGFVATVIIKVFAERFKKAVESKKELNQDELRKALLDSLVTFIYLEGNHDVWKKSMGFKPLRLFERELLDFIIREIKRILKSYELNFEGVRNIVESKIIHDNPVNKIFYTTPSGLNVKVGHPFTARNLTVSISGERFMQMYLKAHINFVGNWHVGLSMEHFDQEIGQRVYVQLPTIQRYTEFENARIKETDFGIGICRVVSHKGRILMSETGFYGEKGDEQKIDNDIIDEMLVRVGVPLQ